MPPYNWAGQHRDRRGNGKPEPQLMLGPDPETVEGVLAQARQTRLDALTLTLKVVVVSAAVGLATGAVIGAIVRWVLQ